MKKKSFEDLDLDLENNELDKRFMSFSFNVVIATVLSFVYVILCVIRAFI